MSKTEYQLKAEIAGRLLATQLAQIQIWKADEVNLERLTTTCSDLAEQVVEESRMFTKIMRNES